MNEVTEFFRGLFSTNEWPPRWNCGYWTDFHGWLYILSDLMIWIAYFLIPLIILHYLTKKKEALKFNKAYIYFAAFIVLCGTTHFLDAMMFWIPMYRLNALVRLLTAVVSLATVYYLIKILPEIFKLRTNLELEREIQKRIIAEKKLEEANKGLQAFVYIASHDLQEPLRKISIYSSQLFDANRHQFDEKSTLLSNKILGSWGRMHAMITDVLSLSTLNDEVEFGVVDPAKAIDAALDILEVKILEKNAVINVGILPSVHGNEAYLSQLFLNLIGNALKFSTLQPVINITAETLAGKVKIYVSDNGIGMRKEDQQKIFDAFQRLNLKTEYEGSGIGLAICKKIVDIHKGGISVSSKLGEGTTFIVELPTAQ